MKGTLLKIFSAILVISLIFTVIFTDQYYVRKQQAEKGQLKLAIQQAEEKQKEEKEEQQKEEQAEKAREMATYEVQIENLENKSFLNKVDGYSISVPRNMSVDMSISSVRAVLENDNERIEIYRQEIEDTTGSSIKSYTDYSNLFIKNRYDHIKEYAGEINIDGRHVSILQWSRKPLKNIENDRCHYASVEVPISEREVITFLFKNNRPFENKEYLDVIKSLKLADRTENPYTRKIGRTKNKFWDKNTRRTYEKFFSEKSRLSWGIFENGAPVDFTELKKIEAKIDFKFPIVLYYTGFIEHADRHPRLATALENAKKEGRLVELTLQTTEQSSGEGNMVYDVLDGKYDTFLKNYAEEVAHSGSPVLFRLGNEMNGDWCVYSSEHTSKDTEIYKAFYRYIYKVFQDAGADNVIWIWNPNAKSFPDFKWNNELCYFPGDEYVDVVGMTRYNTGTYYQGETWIEFDQMYDSLYKKYTSLYDKPLMITEFSSSSVGGDKEAWVRRMFQHIKEYKKVKVAVWWDGCDWDAEGNIARPYFIDESEELIKIFKGNLAAYKN